MFFATFAVTALVPLLVGFVWYNPKVFGTAWMAATGLNQDSMKGANMALIFGLTYVFSFFLAFSINFSVIHQFHLYSLFADPTSKAALDNPDSNLSHIVNQLMGSYGTSFRTYKHGAFHGTLLGLFFATPIIAINALFERKGFKYIAINAGFWIVCCIIMGALICHWQVLTTIKT